MNPESLSRAKLMLSKVVRKLRDHGNPIMVIEQNLDVTETADRVIDLGPEGGAGDGMIIAPGTSEDVAMKWSYRGTQMPFPDLGLRCRLTGDRLTSTPARGVVAGTVAGPLP